ncbi:substrate-binding periplasmic protein [Vibrio caribbeanicus]|uniref:substrate-binding periplasmic protein n=1 Tax=Vibrio caribbeanicus TaxID=701175 RepID=UPI0022852275|nr:transporter substrate-binding domain-containing protein [Vibrio caribbeanicus]MCY9844575.1 transporter substrate-binding domain-containing protein [Vibrio caribbeanicus]
MKTPLSILLLFCSFSVYSQTKLVTAVYPPYVTLEQGRASGIAVKIVKRVFERLGQPLQINIAPFVSAMNDTSSGKFDGIFPVFKTPEREEFASYMAEMLFEQNIVIMGMKVSNKVWNKDILENVSLCLVDGFSYGELMDQMLKYQKFKAVERVKTPMQCLRLLMNNRVDFWMHNDYGARYLLLRHDARPHVYIRNPPVDSVPSYLAFSIKGGMTEEEIRNANYILEEMKITGEYHQIIEDFFQDLSY